MSSRVIHYAAPFKGVVEEYEDAAEANRRWLELERRWQTEGGKKMGQDWRPVVVHR